MDLKRRAHEADAVLSVTPEYNYSVPGVLKNAIGWASRPYGDRAWSGKPAAIMGASVGMFRTAGAVSPPTDHGLPSTCSRSTSRR